VDASAITAVDFSAGAMLRELQQDLAKQGVVLALTRVSSGLQSDLDDLGLTATIGDHLIFISRRDCLTAYQAAFGQAGGGDGAVKPEPADASKPQTTIQ
jgi:hypothetical protein